MSSALPSREGWRSLRRAEPGSAPPTECPQICSSRWGRCRCCDWLGAYLIYLRLSARRRHDAMPMTSGGHRELTLMPSLIPGRRFPLGSFQPFPSEDRQPNLPRRVVEVNAKANFRLMIAVSGSVSDETAAISTAAILWSPFRDLVAPIPRWTEWETVERVKVRHQWRSRMFVLEESDVFAEFARITLVVSREPFPTEIQVEPPDDF